MEMDSWLDSLCSFHLSCSLTCEHQNHSQNRKKIDTWIWFSTRKFTCQAMSSVFRDESIFLKAEHFLFYFYFYWICWVTLVNKILQVSGVQCCNTPSVCWIVCWLPSPFIPSLAASPSPRPVSFGNHHTVVCEIKAIWKSTASPLTFS